MNGIIHSLNGLGHLSEMFWKIKSSTDFWKAVNSTLESLNSIINFQNGIVLIYNHDKHSFDWQRTGSVSKSLIREITTRFFDTIFHYVITDKRPLILDHSIKEILNGYNPVKAGKGACLAVPILLNQQAIGIIILENKRPRMFTEQDMHLAMLYANHLGFSYHRLQYPIVEESMALRYHHLFERINVPLFYCSREGILQFANQAFLDLMEIRDIQEAIEIDLFNQIEFVKHKQTQFQDLIKRCGYFKNLEAQLHRFDGQELTVLISILPLRDEKREVSGFEGVIWDISDRRELEDQLIQAQKLGALGSLTGGIAHDFNNLIGGIMGCASMLLTEMPESHPFYGDILTIMSASKRAAELTGQLLTFSRKHKYQLKNVNTRSLIQEVFGLLSHTLPKNIQIKTEIDDDISPIVVDATQIEQALMNICINARDAMPHGGVLTLEAHNIVLDERATQITRILEPGPYVLFRIRDTGSGMSKELQEHIFEPFFTTKSVNNGSGLGLAIVAEIVQKHHGCISVQSEKGKGSLFEMLIPAGMTEEEKALMKTQEMELWGGTETLLLVDDEAVIRRMSKRMLERFGYKVVVACDGLEAIEVFRNESIDLAIIDMIMPRLDGFKTLKQLQKVTPDVKAILFSGNVTEEGKKRCFESGFKDLVTKPFEASYFLQVVRRVIDAA
jgi:PAS domain S-box-containing protein